VLTGDQSVYPDPLSFRTGVTTMADAGSSGWRNFEDFKQRVIDRARTRVLAFVNIVADGMGPKGENDPADMDAEACARLAAKYPNIIVGFKTAHYSGPGWPSIDGVTKAGRLANRPVMIDFGVLTHERNLKILMEEKLRKGDIYTHCFSGHRDEVENGQVNPALKSGRAKGVFFDIGHGGGSFYWHVATAAMRQGFKPDSLSSDLHTGSMNSGFKDMPNLMSKFLALGMTLEEVVRASTWNPAQQILHPELGHLTEGAEADISVFRLDRGQFGFLDSAGARLTGTQRLTPEMTLRAGRVMWDLNGRSGPDWRKFSYPKNQYKK
jgi:dihydroorotase